MTPREVADLVVRTAVENLPRGTDGVGPPIYVVINWHQGAAGECARELNRASITRHYRARDTKFDWDIALKVVPQLCLTPQLPVTRDTSTLRRC